MAPGGQLVTILASSAGAAAPALLYRSITVHYEFMGTHVAFDVDPAHQGAVLTSIARLVDHGLVHPHIGAVYPLASVAEAHRQIESGHTMGKLVVTVAADG